MKFKIDENLPVEVASLLQKEGNEAKTVLQQQLSGAPDTYIAKIFLEEPFVGRLWIFEESRIRIRGKEDT